MAKKKGRAAKTGGENEEDEVTTDEEELHTDPSRPPTCPHVGKAIHVNGIKRALKISWVRVGQCGPCAKERRTSNNETLSGPKKGATAVGKKTKGPSSKPQSDVPKNIPQSTNVWLCLRCGAQNCGTDLKDGKSHAKFHYQIPRSDLHCVCVCVKAEEPWSIFCFECNSELYIDSYKKLREAVNFVKNVSEKKPAVTAPKASAKPPTPANNSAVKAPTMSEATVIPKGRGLANLGNTCFFNAVAQCLNQSHPLTHIVDQHSRKGATFTLPPIEDNDEPTVIQLAEAGSILLALTAFLKEMNSVGKSGVVNPGHLFGQICNKSSQFRGFQQQDAHELLRHLLEGLRSEEVKRQKTAVLKLFNLTEKSDPKTVTPKVRRQLQAFSRFVNHTIVDKIFGGQLVSTIVCEQCQNSSQIYEPFLDMSLPLIEEKPQRPSGKKSKNLDDPLSSPTVSCFSVNKKKNDDSELLPKSKHQKKKEREKAKKERRKTRKQSLKQEEPTKELNQEGDEQSDDSKRSMVAEKDQAEEGQEECDAEANGLAEKCLEDNQKEDINEEEVNEEEINEETAMEEKCVKKVNKLIVPEVLAESVKGKQVVRRQIDGDEEDDEDDGYSEEEEDWEWDYGEQWDEDEQDKSVKSSASKSEYLQLPSDLEQPEPPKKEKLVSLNPLPPEQLAMRSSSEREKSSEPTGHDEDDESGASSNADIEDNLDENKVDNIRWTITEDVDGELSDKIGRFQPDSNCLDPHMEQLCRNVRRLSVSSAAFPEKDTMEAFAGRNNGTVPEDSQEVTNASAYQTAVQSSAGEVGEEDENSKSNSLSKLKINWVARSLTSISPRYHAKSGECSIYSCLTQFTSPELLTGNNKWACERCTKIQAEKRKNNAAVQSEDISDANNEDDEDEESEKKSPPVYSNASKQLLIFSPPAVLTIHLKRFQQTMYNLRKVNRHVEFPLVLDLAPFCSSTSLSTSNVDPGVKDIKYYLFGVVEHSGRLQGGHYTAFIKARPTNVNKDDYSKFYSSPSVKTDEIYFMLQVINEKIKKAAMNGATNPAKGEESDIPSGKWYHISDSHVTEVTEERVLKCQAYLLFYERVN